MRGGGGSAQDAALVRMPGKRQLASAPFVSCVRFLLLCQLVRQKAGRLSSYFRPSDVSVGR